MGGIGPAQSPVGLRRHLFPGQSARRQGFAQRQYLTGLTGQVGVSAPRRQHHLRDRAPEPTFDAKHVADAVLYMASLPLDANVQFLTITATKMPFIGRG